MPKIQSISDIRAGKYYVGMTVNDLQSEKQKKTFSKIDTDHDNILSLDEISIARSKKAKKDIFTKVAAPLVLPASYLLLDSIHTKKGTDFTTKQFRFLLPLAIAGLLFSAAELISIIVKYKSENKAYTEFLKDKLFPKQTADSSSLNK